MWSKTDLVKNRNGWELIRRLYLQQDKIKLINDKCVQCDICIDACPKEALFFEEKENSRFLNVDPEKCSFCGACSAACLYKAIYQTKNNKLSMPVVTYEVFPRLLGGSMALDERKMNCNGCGTCVVSCPQGAISIIYTEEGPKLVNDIQKCAGCLTCEANCPFDIISSHAVFSGEYKIDHAKCKSDCSDCIEKCPMDALYRLDTSLDGKGPSKIQWDEKSCTYCRACEFICPEKCITVKREIMKVFPEVYATPVFDKAKLKLLDIDG